MVEKMQRYPISTHPTPVKTTAKIMSIGTSASLGFRASPVGSHRYIYPDIDKPRLANRLMPLAKFSVAPTSRHCQYSCVGVKHFHDLGLEDSGTSSLTLGSWGGVIRNTPQSIAMATAIQPAIMLTMGHC